MISLDLGQSGARIRVDGKLYTSARAQRPGGQPMEAIADIFKELPACQSDVVALSLSGFNGVVRNEVATAQVCHDAVGARHVAVIDDGLAGYFGAQKGTDGVTLLIGGGVVSVGSYQGKFAHRDGLGTFFGDEGSGFWIGSRGITRALASRQGRDVHLDLVRELEAVLAQVDAMNVKNGAEASRLAITTAKDVLAAADKGITAAIAIRDEGAYLLARTVIASWLGTGAPANGTPSVIIYGGLSRNVGYKEKIKEFILKELPNATFAEPQGDNLDGAEWIAGNVKEDNPPLLKWVHF